MAAENIDDVVDGLAGIVREAGRAGDRAGYFAALYRQVTVEVRTAIHRGLFDDGARMDRFDTHFGNRYFDAYDAWRRDRGGPRCWREAFGLLDDADTVIVQHLILGVNAHINLDLAVAAARTGPGEAIHALRRDFLLINDILARVVLAVQDSVGALSPFMSLLDRIGARTDERILDFSIRQSREEAWYNAVLLAGQDEEEREATLERLDIRTAVLARLAARPSGLVRPALQLIGATESDDVAAVITHLDSAMARPSARQGPG
ncbi:MULTISPECIES: DUF5995 family protein [Streptomyces]|uniref:Uncharacterized protein n=1 Tax=Streptomyces lycii TaxID=2654337 RepID=A0ABQ7FN19_9ACTN|nr:MULTISPECIES: DUF5995 family protein [Streptomyces]KAF4409024.1 hypothetical protein GCU69_11085 [Streptomyces lycii]PGH52104.1 hypothetical protein CRI70_03050 [Streptomyces sp. Ru87]